MRIKNLILAVVAVVMLLSVATPVFAQDDLSRLTIDNESNKTAYITLRGPRSYYLTTLADTEKIWTVEKGVYTYSLNACGVTVTGTLDMNKHKRFIVPACGTKSTQDQKPSDIDVGEVIKLVKVKLTNNMSTNLILILTGPETFVFPIAKGETKTYTIPKGKYAYTAYGCGTTQTGNYWATTVSERTFTCRP